MAVGPRDEYAAIIKGGMEKVVSKGGMTFLSTSLPFFSIPIVHMFAEHVLEELAEYLISKGEIGALALYIDLRTTQQGRDYWNALKHELSLPPTATPEERQHAEDERIRKFALLGHLGS